MAITFKVVELGNPLKPEAPKKSYARVVSSGDITLRALSKEIASKSTVGMADVTAVLESLIEVLPAQLAEGKIVRLGDFGTFSVSITSEGQDKLEKVTAKTIKANKMVFRPGKALKSELDKVEYKKQS